MKKRTARIFLALCIMMVCFVAMAVTFSAVAGGAYQGYVLTGGESPADMIDKQVNFNGKKWFIIKDESTSNTAGTVTLLAVESFGSSKFGTNNVYSSSTIKSMLDTMVSSGSFKDVASAIKSVDLDDVSVTGVKLYLLSNEEANHLPDNVKGTVNQSWWLRTPDNDNKAFIIVGPVMNKSVLGSQLKHENAVRPALQLDLSKVIFIKKNKEFLPKDTYRYTSGDGSSWTMNSSLPMHFKIEGDHKSIIGKFEGIKVDNNKVDDKDFEAAEGSVEITLKASYLETLNEGEHKLTARFRDGEANAKFTVVKSAVNASSMPQTGDNSNIPLYLAVGVGAIVALTALSLRKRT